MREYLVGMHGCIRRRRGPRRSKLVPSPFPVAPPGWHAPPRAKCHTYILTSNAREVASAVSSATAMVASHGIDRREGCLGTVHSHPKYCKLLQTIANYSTISTMHDQGV